MPLRSPKRNFFIFGFQRFVWWPKCTPASNNSLIETTPIPSPPLKACRAPIGEGARPLILKPSDVSDVDVYFDKFPSCALSRKREPGTLARSLGTLAQWGALYKIRFKKSVLCSIACVDPNVVVGQVCRIEIRPVGSWA